jgi:hypothetical protein
MQTNKITINVRDVAILIEGFINPTKVKERGKLIHLDREPFSSKSEIDEDMTPMHTTMIGAWNGV